MLSVLRSICHSEPCSGVALSEDTKPLHTATSLLKVLLASVGKLKTESRIKGGREQFVTSGHADTAGSRSTFLPQILIDTLHYCSGDTDGHRSILLTDTLECMGWNAGTS